MQEKLFMPILGISDLDSYKKEASGIFKIKDIKNTPLLVMKAENDPIIGWDQ